MTAANMNDTPYQADPADICAREPIHMIGAIQPHGALVVVTEADRRILHVSANAADMLGCALTPGQRLDEAAGRELHCTTHYGPQGMMLEFEPPAVGEQPLEVGYGRLQVLIDQVEKRLDVRDLSQTLVEQVRAITGFHRVLLYRFDAAWNGTVIAEDNDGTLPSYLDLRFPASDIPAQARALYFRNRLRLIPDAGYVPVPIDPLISPLDGQPLDLSASSLRAVSPMHIQYMLNMGTPASMSIPMIADGRLWGLVTCHHARPRVVGPRLRAECALIGQLAGQQIVARERMATSARRIALKSIETGLVVKLTGSDSLMAALAADPAPWMALAASTGVAVVQEGQVACAGQTPAPDAILAMAEWLGTRAPPLFASDALPAAFPPAAAFADRASGLLAVSVSQLHASFIMWFRPEVIQTVTWAGEPEKSPDLGPRASFAEWQELVRHTAVPWRPEEIEAAVDLRRSILDFVLRQAEERAALTERLEASNKELEAFSYSVSHDLRAPFRHIVGYAELLRDREKALDATSSRFLNTISDAALAAGRLVDDLLAFSQLNRTPLAPGRIDMGKLVQEAQKASLIGIGDRRIEWRIGPLPEARGDATLLRQALLNLLSNAVKYTGRREVAEICVSAEETDSATIYIVRDNGIGFDMRYVGKLFGVFQRLHRVEDFEGTGIGLALTKRVIDRHGGWIKAEAVLDQGATFTFALPRREILLA
jgi:chemotaxis family two-component system sensor kinase Cph1